MSKLIEFILSIFNVWFPIHPEDGGDVKDSIDTTTVVIPVIDEPQNDDNGYFFILDAGHGQETKGKKSPYFFMNGKRVRFEEWEFNRDVIRRIATKLDKQGLDYMFTVHPEDKKDLSLTERVKIANDYQTDKQKVFISVHANAGYAKSSQDWQAAHGVEVWHYYRSKKGQAVAAHFQREIVKATEWRNRGLKSKKKNQFYVLRKTRFPAVLTESGFYNHLEQCFELMQSETREIIADAHVKAINKIML